MSINPAHAAAAPQEHAVCQEHNENVAVGTCARCGRFVCDACVSDERLCSECVRRQIMDVPSSANLARWSTRLLAAHVVADSLFILLAIQALLAPGPSTARLIFEGLIGLGTFVLIVATGITFLRWLHSSVRQAEALGIDVEATPGWAVGYWFIPFVNLVKPRAIIRNLLAGLGGQALVEESRVGVWWGMWIAGNVLSQMQSRLSMSNGLDAPTSSGAYAVGILASAASIAGALLCIGVVRTAQRGLDARRS